MQQPNALRVTEIEPGNIFHAEIYRSLERAEDLETQLAAVAAVNSFYLNSSLSL